MENPLVTCVTPEVSSDSGRRGRPSGGGGWCMMEGRPDLPIQWHNGGLGETAVIRDNNLHKNKRTGNMSRGTKCIILKLHFSKFLPKNCHLGGAGAGKIIHSTNYILY